MACDSLATKNSDIGRVRRFISLCIADKLVGHEWLSVAFKDVASCQFAEEHSIGSSMSKLRYPYEIHRYGLPAKGVRYHSLSMARAHAMGPARYRISIAWMHGVDAWEDGRADHLSVARGAT